MCLVVNVWIGYIVTQPTFVNLFSPHQSTRAKLYIVMENYNSANIFSVFAWS